MCGRKRNADIEAAESTVGFGPCGRQPSARFVVSDVESKSVALNAQRRCAGILGEFDTATGASNDDAATAFASSKVGPPHIGNTNVVDIGVHARHHYIACEDRPVIPLLVLAETAVQIRPVQRLT
ncbi:unannotated protein [freshwater metagenome]|uniref:Unannotated protein n=1 Tax=freshwater metagenome TaxID=449393 RepID=A0A6J6P8P6_9ZZZZ